MKTNLGVIFIISCIFFGVGGYFYNLLEGRNVCESKGGTYLQGFYKMECIHQSSTAIKDSGCASLLEMPEPKNLKRIDVYKGNE